MDFLNSSLDRRVAALAYGSKVTRFGVTGHGSKLWDRTVARLRGAEVAKLNTMDLSVELARAQR